MSCFNQETEHNSLAWLLCLCLIKRNIKKKITKFKSAWPIYYKDKHLEGCFNFNAMNMVRECFVDSKHQGKYFWNLKLQFKFTFARSCCSYISGLGNSVLNHLHLDKETILRNSKQLSPNREVLCPRLTAACILMDCFRFRNLILNLL